MPRGYAFSLGLDWADYLKVNEIRGVGNDVGELQHALTSQNKKLIATTEEFKRSNIGAIQDLSKSMSNELGNISADIQNVSQNVSELTAAFEWGFSELLAEAGKINDSLQMLIGISKTPAQTWAYEQFEIARDAFKKNLITESLEYLNRSIDGHGDNTGYKLEYRFHMLQGTIYLGSFKNNSKQIIDLEKSENAFLTAAKYAKHDNPNEAGRAFLAAGWSAYCQGKIQEAKQSTEQSIALYPSLGASHFQLAKLLMNEGNPKPALLALSKAIEIDKNYITKACLDKDFMRFDTELDDFIEHIFRQKKEISNNLLMQLDNTVKKFESLQLDELTLKNNSTNFTTYRQPLDKAHTSFKNNTLFGFFDTINLCNQAIRAIKMDKDEFFSSNLSNINSQIYNLDSKESKSTLHDDRHWFETASLFGGLIITVIVAISKFLGKINDPSLNALDGFFSGIGNIITTVIGGFLITVGVFWTVKFIFYNNESSSLKRKKSKLEKMRTNIIKAQKELA